jgi:anti-anti-sigma factor
MKTTFNNRQGFKMQYQVSTRNNTIEVKVCDKITFTDIEGLREIINEMLHSDAGAMVMNLQDVEFIDSAGLGMLLLARDELAKKDGNLILRHPTGQVKRMFDVANFDALFTIEISGDNDFENIGQG